MSAMFCPVCFVEYTDEEEHLTHCPVCGTMLVSSAFEEPIFDDDTSLDGPGDFGLDEES